MASIFLVRSGRGDVESAPGDRCMRWIVVLLGMSVVGAQALGAVWTNTGPGGGRVNSVAVAPSSPATVFAGTGISFFKSIDGGASWTRLVHPVGSVLSGEVAIHPTDPDTIYISGPKVFKSTDGGGTFVDTGLGMTNAQSIGIDPLDPLHLVVGGNSSGTLAYTVDGAATWTVVSPAGASGNSFFSVVFDPVTPQVVYAAASFGVGPGVWKSLDGGASWTKVLTVNNFLGSQAVAVAPSSPATVLAESLA